MLNIKFKQNGGGGSTGGSGDQYYVLLGVHFVTNHLDESTLDYTTNAKCWLPDNVKQYILSMNTSNFNSFNITDFKEKTDETIAPCTIIPGYGAIVTGGGGVQLCKLMIGSSDMNSEAQILNIKILCVTIEDYIKYFDSNNDNARVSGINGKQIDSANNIDGFQTLCMQNLASDENKTASLSISGAHGDISHALRYIPYGFLQVTNE